MKKRHGSLSTARHSPVALRTRLARRLKSWKKGVLLGLLVAGATMLSIGENNRALIAEVLRDPLSIFAQRSPGERGAGALLQTKKRPHSRVAAATRTRGAPHAPTERVLSAVRTRPPPMLGIETLALGPITPVIDGPIFSVPPPLTGGIPPIGVPIAFVNPPPSICCGSEPPVPPVTPPVLPPAPIPEPRTWLTMILGFFAMGWALRRRHTRETRDAAI